MGNLPTDLNSQSQWEIRGSSDWTCQLRQRIARYAPYQSSVLICGPSGTGKELIARSLHQASLRANKLFIPVDCAAVTGELMASQLFGHCEGAFTGASQASLGCFRAAHEGTIFLDEIGELELPLQAKLLRVLQERVVVPVGDHQGVPVDVRVVAATNRNLEEEVQAGRFREDLFYRLNVVSLQTKALAERSEDIRTLTLGFLDQLAKEGLPYKSITAEALNLLERFSWPGNVRQLKNLIEQAVVDCEGSQISRQQIHEMLQDRVGGFLEGDNRAIQPDEPTASVGNNRILYTVPAYETSSFTATDTQAGWITLENLEREHLAKTLEHTFYNRAAAARLLGISRQALLRKMKKYAISAPELPIR